MTPFLENSQPSESLATERPRGLRIAHLLTRSDTIAGGQVHVRDLSLALRAKGHQVTVLLGGNGPFCEDLRRNGIPYRTLSALVQAIDPVHDPLAVLEMRRCFKELKPDLVTTHGSKAGWLGRIAARSLGLPVTFTAHGWAFTPGVAPRRAAFYRLAEMLVAPLATRIITVSEHDRELALRKRVGRADQITTVYYGVPAIADSLHAIPERDPPHIVMVARFDVQKDHQTLFQALADLLALEWTLELVGDGPNEARMRAMAQDLGIADRVQFSGLRGDVAERLARAQVFALISNYEGFPISILEGMRAGLPVIASNVGGSSESVQDGLTGLIVPPRDVAATKAALGRLLSSSALRKEMGAAGRKRFEENFTFDKMVDSTIALYRDATRRLPRS
jgi:glycosyltransferase involved in cell wall biosynthesis